MCGIAGFYGAQVEDAVIRDSVELLKHRGPDDQGFFRQGDVGLIHTRLSIIELSPLGAQPYRFENLTLIFNGELYNYKEVRSILQSRGYSFVSNSDTEVLIKAFHCWREKCVDQFIGMFAFAIYDGTSDELFLFRDRLGVKPLYYFAREGALYFASELNVLARFGLPRTIDLEGVAAYFRFGFISDEKTVFENFAKIKPGHYLVIGRQGMVTHRYWDSGNIIVRDNPRKESDWIDELENLMISAFSYRMVSDVPVGVFLSGGIDSSLLTAILQKHYGGIHSFTIGFDEPAFDESAYAERVASHLKTNHTQKILALEEAKDLFFKFYEYYDEPFADTSGIPTSCVTQLAKQAGMKVVLSADGGDELFGGYTHYQEADDLYRKFKALPYGLRKRISKTAKQALPASVRSRIVPFNVEHKAYAFEELLEADSPTVFFEAFVANQAHPEIARLINSSSSKNNHPLSTDSAIEQMMNWDLHHYLPDDLLMKVDRATMFYSLECREPFLDHRLVEFSSRLPVDLKIRKGKGKYILRQLLKRYLPEEYFERKKQGFSIPIFSWFSKELDSLFTHYLSPENLRSVPFLNAGEIQKEWTKYNVYKKRNKPYNIEKMWRILSFMMWWEKYGEHGA